MYSLLGQLGLGLFRAKSQYLGLIDMPKLWYLRFPPLDTWSIEDESGGDMKMLAVPVQKLTPRYNKIQTIDDVPEDYLAQIRHFFEHYKDLEKGKWAKVSGWTGPEEACKVIMKGVEAYNNAK